MPHCNSVFLLSIPTPCYYTLMETEYFYEINTHSKKSITVLLLQQI